MFDRLFVKDVDEVTLIEEAKTNQQAFARLFDLFADEVYGFVRRRVSSDQDAEDIVSETFMALAARIQDYNADKWKFKTRLFSIANYKFLDKMRKVYEEKEIHIDDEFDLWYEKDFAKILSNKQLYNKILNCVKTLSDRQSSIFFLRYVEELSNKEIASVCDIDERTVSSTLSIVLKRVRDRISNCL